MSRCSQAILERDGNEKLANISHPCLFHVLCFSGFVMASV